MSDYNNGQIHGWNGGECPVHPETVVKFWTRDGRSFSEGTAKCLRWSNLSENSDIIAFQVVKQHVEPKVIWVNEYPSGAVCYETKEDAKSSREEGCTRIAVKYVEAKNE
jgi:hypothetical protein